MASCAAAVADVFTRLGASRERLMPRGAGGDRTRWGRSSSMVAIFPVAKVLSMRPRSLTSKLARMRPGVRLASKEASQAWRARLDDSSMSTLRRASTAQSTPEKRNLTGRAAGSAH